jgi:hypothetical protein
VVINRKQLGREHLETLNAVHDLAVICDCQGQYIEVGTLHKLAWAGQKNCLGPKLYRRWMTSQ